MLSSQKNTLWHLLLYQICHKKRYLANCAISQLFTYFYDGRSQSRHKIYGTCPWVKHTKALNVSLRHMLKSISDKHSMSSPTILYTIWKTLVKLINVSFFSMQNAQMQWWYHRILDFCKKMVLFSLFFLGKEKRTKKRILLTQMYPSFDPWFCHLTTFHDHGILLKDTTIKCMNPQTRQSSI